MSSEKEDGSSTQKEILRFKCTLCGKCCYDKNTFVNLTFTDILKIKNGMKADAKELLDYIAFYTFNEEELKQKLIQMVYSPILTEKGPAYVGMLKKENGRCTFLNDENKCSIHDFRPRICETFPFTLDLSNIERNKTGEIVPIFTSKGLDYCPGISKSAPIVKVKKLQHLLSLSVMEISSDFSMIEAWNNMVNRGDLTPIASNYIRSLIVMEKKQKDRKKSNIKISNSGKITYQQKRKGKKFKN